MESDERFKHLASDPRFKTLRRKQRKVQIDDRFKSMFTDEKFTLKYKQDKRGRSQKKTSGDDLRKYYHLDEKDEKKEKDDDAEEEDEGEDKDVEEDEEQVSGEEGEENELAESAIDEEEEEEDDDDDDDDDELGNGVFRRGIDDDDQESTASEDISSSSDESDSEGPESETDDVVEKIQYDWQPLDHDAERADIVTKRIAIQNLDWNHLDVRDVYTLVNSIRPPLNVKIYVSEFGKERLAKEEIEGPQELAEMPEIDEEEQEYKQLEEKMQALQNKERKYKVNEYEDADEIVDAKNEEIRERLRRYQLSQMKYYYAIAEFDSPDSAQAVYKELDGIEYEGSSLELDLRYVPDDMEFDPADIKAECDKVPDLATYKAPLFINSALQQTTVKFTWDETDIRRQEKLNKAYTKQELEKDDLEAYLASETDSEDEEADEDGDKSETMTVMTGNSEARANKYRQLLKSLDEEAARKKKADVDVEWGDYDSDADEQLQQQREHDEDDDDGDGEFEEEDDDDEEEEEEEEDEEDSDNLDSDDEDVRKAAKSKIKMKMKKKEQDRKEKTKAKRSKKSKRKQEEMEPADPELDLLVMDARANKQEDFKFDPDDDRFRAVYESGLYNIDPSHPNFKRTEAFDRIAERKRDKRRKRDQ